MAHNECLGIFWREGWMVKTHNGCSYTISQHDRYLLRVTDRFKILVYVGSSVLVRRVGSRNNVRTRDGAIIVAVESVVILAHCRLCCMFSSALH